MLKGVNIMSDEDDPNYPRLSRGNIIIVFFGLVDADLKSLLNGTIGKEYEFKKEKAIKKNGYMYLPEFKACELIKLKLSYMSTEDEVLVFTDEKGKKIQVLKYSSLDNCYSALFSCNRPRKANYVLSLVK